MKSVAAAPLLMSIIFCGLGCAQTRTYEVSVRNDTPGPVTLWLFKAGGPYENGWKSPEDLAIESPKANEPIGGRIIAPGAIASAGPVQGQFDSDSSAILRVYRGSHTFNQLLAIGASSGDRVEAPLHPGDNQFLVAEHHFKLSLDPVSEIPSTQSQQPQHEPMQH
jgi:hypothetical protein